MQEIEVKIGGGVKYGIEQGYDPFSSQGEDLKKMGGVGATPKKRINRALTKSRTGIGASSSQIEDEAMSGYGLFQVVYPPYNMAYLSKIYEMSSAHYAATNAKAANIVGLGYDFVEKSKTVRSLESKKGTALRNARRRIAEAKDALHEYLGTLNNEDSFQETLRKVWIDYETTGNGYIEIGRDAEGDIGYIGHIPAVSMRIRRDRDGFVQIISNKASFFRNFGEKTTNPINDEEPNEVIHIKKYSPTNGYYGVPDVIPAINAIVGNEFSSRYNLEYFENRAVPRYVIVVKGGKLSENSEKQVIDFFEANLKGQNHRTLFVPLPSDTPDSKVSFDMKPVEIGIQDSSFGRYRKDNVNDVLMAHRVPANKVGLAEGVSLAIARDADKTFKEQVCRPEQTIFESKIGKVFAEITDMFYFRLNELTLTDEDTQSKITERLVRNQIMNQNEGRAASGMPPVEGGEKFIEQTPQRQAEARAQTAASRTRDAERSGAAPDIDGESRNPQGEGRQVA